MLETLQHMSPKQMISVLAAAARETGSTLPEFEGGKPKSLDGPVRDLIQEIHTVLKIPAEDNSNKSRKAIDEFLVRAIRNVVLGKEQEDIVLQNVAKHGLLSPSAYKVEFDSDFNRLFKALGGYRNTVEEAVLRPDDFQHLMTDPPFVDESELFSLFVKKGTRPELGAHWLLVQTLRKGITQLVQCAWWVHAADVDVSRVEKPLDLLRAFVDKFGIPLRMGEKSGKYIEDAVLDKTPGEPASFEFEVNLKTDEYFWTASSRVKLEEDRFQVGIAYCIDLKMYRTALLARGAI